VRHANIRENAAALREDAGELVQTDGRLVGEALNSVLDHRTLSPAVIMRPGHESDPS
jgi:hypothetical protein